MRTLHKICMFVTAIVLLRVDHAIAERICFTTGATQFVEGIEYCVSSKLSPAGVLTYGPDNLTDARPATAWCEGVKGLGEGETIEMTINRGSKFRRLLVQNGYGKSETSYQNNGRIKKLEIATDTGSKTTATLPDSHELATIDLPSPDTYRRLIVTILEVYPGQKDEDTCLDYLTPDFEYEETLATKPDTAAPAAPGTTAEPPAAPVTPAQKPQAADPFGDLGFPKGQDLKLKGK